MILSGYGESLLQTRDSARLVLSTQSEGSLEDPGLVS